MNNERVRLISYGQPKKFAAPTCATKRTSHEISSEIAFLSTGNTHMVHLNPRNSPVNSPRIYSTSDDFNFRKFGHQKPPTHQPVLDALRTEPSAPNMPALLPLVQPLS
jgi:hypothetical protein